MTVVLCFNFSRRLSSLSPFRRRSGNSGSWIWIRVSDVDALYEEFLAKGASVRHPPANYPWGSRELHVEDPDGNVLRLGSENKPGESFGDWIDMRGIRWRRKPEGGWARVD